MRVLVTGATGFVGRALCLHLRDLGIQVVCASRQTISPTDNSEEVPVPTWIPIPERAPPDEGATGLQGIDCVIHLAARVHVMREESIDPSTEFRRSNTQATLHLAAQAAAAGVKRFVYLSSAKVNGEGRDQDIRSPHTKQRGYSESDPTAPDDAYALSKWEAEQGLMSLAKGGDMEIVVIRPPLVYGPGVKGNFAFLAKCVRKGIPLPLGAVTNRRSLIALDNLVDFITLCASREISPRAANQLFLIADGKDVSTTELLKKVAEAYGVAPRLLPIPASWMRFGLRLIGMRAWADRLLGPLQVDSSKARDLLGWRPVVTMDEQLRKMARHDSAL